MNFIKKILILTVLFFVNIEKNTAQVKPSKTKQEQKIAKEILEIDNEIKDAEKTPSQKVVTGRKKTTKKKAVVVKEDMDTTLPNVTGTGKVLTGIASFYSASFEGKQTANGEIFRHSKLTCASNKFPLGTWLKITNLKNNKTIVVKVNDRMHPRMKRLVDLTLTGAKALNFVAAGLTQVKAEVIKKK